MSVLRVSLALRYVLLLAAVQRLHAITLEDLDEMIKNDIEQFCQLTTCTSALSSCPSGTRFEEGMAVSGCCGVCVKFMQEGETCTGKRDPRPCRGQPYLETGYGTCSASSDACPETSSSRGGRAGEGWGRKGTGEVPREARSLGVDGAVEDSNIVKSSWCDYGMFCSNSKCVIDPCWVTCRQTQEAFDIDMTTDGNYVDYRDDYRWRPDCDQEGKFAPKQCKGSTWDDVKTCICVDPEGNDLPGKAFNFEDELYTSMNCLCSRHVYELNQAGRTDVTLHCVENGNYEPLQCEDGWCYCVHPENGTIWGYQLPEAAMNLLPCFNATQVGELYLRECESRLHAHRVITAVMSGKSATTVPVDPVACSQDGSYAPKRCLGSSCTCINKYGQDCLVREGALGCVCTRDQLKNYEYGRSYLNIVCQLNTGIYNTTQQMETKQAVYFVDGQGVRTGPIIREVCEDNLRVDDLTKCQLLGNNPVGNTYCQQICYKDMDQTGGTQVACEPWAYLNSGEYSTSPTAC